MIVKKVGYQAVPARNQHDRAGRRGDADLLSSPSTPARCSPCRARRAIIVTAGRWAARTKYGTTVDQAEARLDNPGDLGMTQTTPAPGLSRRLSPARGGLDCYRSGALLPSSVWNPWGRTSPVLLSRRGPGRAAWTGCQLYTCEGMRGRRPESMSPVDDPFYGFNAGATHVRTGGDGDPIFYQFEGPLLRLMTDEGYQLLVHGDQHQYLLDARSRERSSRGPCGSTGSTIRPLPPSCRHRTRTWSSALFRRVHQHVTADGFGIESAAAGLYDLIMLIRGDQRPRYTWWPILWAAGRALHDAEDLLSAGRRRPEPGTGAEPGGQVFHLRHAAWRDRI